MSRELTPPPALAGLDLAGHRERAKRALALHLGGQNLRKSPTEWEAEAEAVLVLLERYGVVPVWAFDPKIARLGLGAIEAHLLMLFGKPAAREPAARADASPLAQPGVDNCQRRARFGYFFPDDVGGGE